jgi:uncharacterized protein (DUF2147 family)
MRNFLLFVCMAVFCAIGFANPNARIEGTWTTIDDETKQHKSWVNIQKNSNGTYSGTVIKLLLNPDFRCEECDGNKKGRPVLGMTVLWDLKPSEDQHSQDSFPLSFDDGKILDPKTGKIYKAKATVSQNGSQLKVRGFMGVPALGRTQTWIRNNSQ